MTSSVLAPEPSSIHTITTSVTATTTLTATAADASTFINPVTPFRGPGVEVALLGIFYHGCYYNKTGTHV